MNKHEFNIAAKNLLDLDPNYSGEALLWLNGAGEAYDDVINVVRKYIDMHRYREVHPDPEE